MKEKLTKCSTTGDTTLKLKNKKINAEKPLMFSVF